MRIHLTTMEEGAVEKVGKSSASERIRRVCVLATR